MEEIVVARPDRSMLVAVAVITVFVLAVAAPYGNMAALLVVAATSVASVLRLRQMKLSVTRASVVVVNYLARHEVPLNTVRIIDEKDQLVGPMRASAGFEDGKLYSSGRALYVTDDSGRKVRVGLAPMHGSRLDTIAEDLYRAIARMRTGG